MIGSTIGATTPLAGAPARCIAILAAMRSSITLIFSSTVAPPYASILRFIPTRPSLDARTLARASLAAVKRSIWSTISARPLGSPAHSSKRNGSLIICERISAFFANISNVCEPRIALRSNSPISIAATSSGGAVEMIIFLFSSRSLLISSCIATCIFASDISVATSALNISSPVTASNWRLRVACASFSCASNAFLSC